MLFYAWGFIYKVPSAALGNILPGAEGLFDGPWLLAGVIGGLVIRKPGAALYTELLAAVVEGLMPNQWGGLLTIEAGLIQGLGAELVFAIFLYRRWGAGVAMLAGAGAGLFGAINNLVLWYGANRTIFKVMYLPISTISSAFTAGLLGWLIVRGLAKTGALERFPVGREK